MPEKYIRGVRPSAKYQKLFEKYNRLYYDGELPPTIVSTAPLLKITQLTQKEVLKPEKLDTGDYACLAYVGKQPYIILDRGTAVFHQLITHQSLLHEMAHLYLMPYKWHGERFKAEMRRLAAMGAFDGLL